MSADNLVYAIPFQKMTGEVVWRVGEAQLSGLTWSLCHQMSTAARVLSFREFQGPEAAKAAHVAAEQLARSLPVCEYGTSLSHPTEPPFTMLRLQEDAVRDGYKEQDVYALREASDEDFAHKEVAYWAEN